MEHAISYVGLKFAAYVAWCALGVWMFRPQARSLLRSALAFGTLRLMIGVVLGVSLFVLAAVLKVGNWNLSHLAIYLLMYVPLRWVEWSIVGWLLQADKASLLLGPIRLHSAGDAVSTASGSRSAGVMWKMGGIVVSHLADLPVIMAVGGINNMLPVGRFLC